MTTPVAPHRSVRIPQLMRVVRGPSAVMDALADLVERDHRLLIVHSGRRSATGYGATIEQHARRSGYPVGACVIAANSEAFVTRVVDAIDDFRPDFVLAVGGGRVVDVAKLAAARRQARIVTIPTQLASDAICSPVAIILDAEGRQQSVGAQMPVAIVVDMDVVDSAPSQTWLSGLGDLVSNLSAVRDWRLAHDRRAEAFDDFASLTSEAAALSVIEDDADVTQDDYRQKLIRGLILSGIAMEMAGSSRPASGSEHLISHALDQILAVPRAHGLQVAVGTIAATILRGEDGRRLVGFYRRVGLPVVPGDLDIAIDDFMAAVRRGPATRPGRTTCLDDVSEADLGRLRQAYDRGEL
ncbi:MAG: iron-containing alcohol dehydrogenase [Candidatus Limnocylindrales bacterium]